MNQLCLFCGAETEGPCSLCFVPLKRGTETNTTYAQLAALGGLKDPLPEQLIRAPVEGVHWKRYNFSVRG